MFSFIAWISVAIAGLSFLIISLDEVRHPQKMWIMNVVWPVTALYFSIVALWGYFDFGRKMARGHDNSPMPQRDHEKADLRNVSWRAASLSASHCGAGCAVADILCETVIFIFGLTLMGQSLYASFVLDLIVAWLFGVAFQYFMIRPMKQLPAGAALRLAIKADTLSILSFQIGMYTWMAIVYFILFPHPHLTPDHMTFWWMMQIGMIFGFFTTYPTNVWLVKTGIKESMM